MRRALWSISFLLTLGFEPPGHAQTSPKVEQFKLDNGLTVIVKPDRRAPTAVHMVWVRAGAMDEVDGMSGVAHVVEHMMFKGSENVGSGEHFMLVFTNGGTMNGTTNKDRTLYFETLPANQLDLGIFLHGALDLPFTTRVLMNLPHIAIGGFAAFTGFVLARRWAPSAAGSRPAGARY